jgi:hypothetical protein
MRETLPRTICRCGKNEGDLVMSREHFQETILINANAAREVTLDHIIQLLTQQKQMWFSQSLTAGSSAFWANKVKTTEQLIKEIEGLK